MAIPSLEMWTVTVIHETGSQSMAEFWTEREVYEYLIELKNRGQSMHHVTIFLPNTGYSGHDVLNEFKKIEEYKANVFQKA